MTKRKIIIDCDPGIDDAYALIAALLYPEFDVVGITTVAGNVNIDDVTRNATCLSSLLDKKTPVYKGETSIADKIQINASNVHGYNGLGGVILRQDLSLLKETSAVDFILETVKNNPNEIEIIALGPLTNLASAITKDFTTMKQIKTIYTMGGGINEGNITPVAEYNYWFDPKAVNTTLLLGPYVPIYLMPVNTTHHVIFDCNDLWFIERFGGKIGKLLTEMSQCYLEEYWVERKITGCIIHDMILMLFAINHDLSKLITRSNVRVCETGISRGQTVIDLKDVFGLEKNANIVLNIDVLDYKESFIEIMFSKSVKEIYRKYISKREE